MKKEISVLIIAHNEEKIINECLSLLDFADEIVIVLDNCNDKTEEISRIYTNKIFKGSWEIEGERRNFGISKCTKDWILEIDADEFVNSNLFTITFISFVFLITELKSLNTINLLLIFFSLISDAILSFFSLLFNFLFL